MIHRRVRFRDLRDFEVIEYTFSLVILVLRPQYYGGRLGKMHKFVKARERQNDVETYSIRSCKTFNLSRSLRVFQFASLTKSYPATT